MQVHFKRMDVWIKNARFERITVPDSKLGVRAKEGMKAEKKDGIRQYKSKRPHTPYSVA